jgi:hypothetical protein
MNDRFNFRYIVLISLLLLVIIRFVVFPHWDRQLAELFDRQARLECGSGVITTDGDGHPVCTAPHR